MMFLKQLQSLTLARIASGFAFFFMAHMGIALECPGTPRTVVGTVYCDNQFTLWVNGQEVARDPIAFAPHQAVRVAFEWDGSSSLTYAIQCEDFASDSGYEYTDTFRPQLGDGALIAEFDDGLGTVTDAKWRVYTATFGPTDASIEAGCSAYNLGKCAVDKRDIPEGWIQSNFDDRHWKQATTYSAFAAGWGFRPRWSPEKGCCTLRSPSDGATLGCEKSVPENECLAPRKEFKGSRAEFIWADDLERDNRVLFRYKAECDNP